MAGWCYRHTLAQGSHPHLGCHLSRCFCTLPPAAGSQKSRRCCLPSRMPEAGKICRADCHASLCSDWQSTPQGHLGWKHAPSCQSLVQEETGGSFQPPPTAVDCSGCTEGNAAAVLGTLSVGRDLSDPFFTQKACDQRDLLAGITICFLGTLLLALNDC